MKKIAIIGAGPAGMMAAITAADNNINAQITVFEKNEKIGRKLMITGKGRCNLTNNCDIDTLLSNIPKNPRFLYSAFNAFSPSDLMDFFEKAGVRLKTERGNRVFPVSDKAVDIVDALFKTAKAKNIKIVNEAVKEILFEGDTVTGVLLENGEDFSTDSILIATGGASYPLTGSTGDGYRFAEKTGHTVTELLPSLIPLVCHEGFCSTLSGLSLKNVTLSVFEEGKKKPIFREMGEMLFTHFGISGPLVLSASAYIRHLYKKEYTAYIDLKPALSIEQLDNRILRDFENAKNKDFQNSLDKLLPKSMISVIVRLSNIDANTKVNQISRDKRRQLAELLKALPLHITGTRPIEEAIITSGGVSVKNINPATMESKILKGLFFAGEVIDVDAFTGGFNLQIAFSTGYLAGMNI